MLPSLSDFSNLASAIREKYRHTSYYLTSAEWGRMLRTCSMQEAYFSDVESRFFGMSCVIVDATDQRLIEQRELFKETYDKYFLVLVEETEDHTVYMAHAHGLFTYYTHSRPSQPYPAGVMAWDFNGLKGVAIVDHSNNKLSYAVTEEF